MKIILLESLPKLGRLGEVVNVKGGYARNFLFPQKMALAVTKKNMEYIEASREHLEALNLKKSESAKTLSEFLQGKRYTLIRQISDTGHLYGSVNSRDIMEILSKEYGISIKAPQIRLDTVIKTVGVFEVKIETNAEYVAIMLVNVADSEKNAKAQWTTYDATHETPEKEDKDAVDLGTGEVHLAEKPEASEVPKSTT